jgi:catechol-2,3-dioxygenase
MVAAPRFAHVVFETNQLAAMRDWYCELLEGRVVYEGHGLCFITHDEEHHRVALLEAAERLASKRTGPSGLHDVAGVHHVAYTFASLGDLLARYVALRERGIEPVTPVQHGVTTSMYYQDPDGNFVEMQIDNFSTPQEATAYMEGAEYDADPVGPTYSPEALRAGFEDGVPVTELTTRAWAAAHPFAAAAPPLAQ